jgi:hypothetical protein
MLANLFDSVIQWCDKTDNALKYALRIIFTTSLLVSLIVLVIVAYCFAWAEFTIFLTILHALLIFPIIVWTVKD